MYDVLEYNENVHVGKACYADNPSCDEFNVKIRSFCP